MPTRLARGHPVRSVDSVCNKYAKKLALQSSKIAGLKELCKTNKNRKSCLLRKSVLGNLHLDIFEYRFY